MAERIELELNGEAKVLEVEKNWTLLYVIREVLGLTGTKCGCKTGDCGSCMVVMNGEAARSCMVNARKADGAVILTIEGMEQDGELHPIQQAFIDAGAVQCGFCIPGMIMSAKALLDRNSDPTEEEVRMGIDHNLCRCTGYEKIVEAILLAANRMRGEGLWNSRHTAWE